MPKAQKRKPISDLCVVQLQADVAYFEKGEPKVEKCEEEHEDHTEDDYETVELMRRARHDAQTILEHAERTIIEKAKDPKRPRRSAYDLEDKEQVEVFEKARCAYVLNENLKRAKKHFRGFDMRGMGGSLYHNEVPFTVSMET